MEEDIRVTANNTIKMLKQITSSDIQIKHLEKLKKIANLSDEVCNSNNPKEINYYKDIINALKFIGKVEFEKMKNNTIN